MINNTIKFKIPYFDSFLYYEGIIVSDNGSYFMVKITTDCLMNGTTTAVYKEFIKN